MWLTSTPHSVTVTVSRGPTKKCCCPVLWKNIVYCFNFKLNWNQVISSVALAAFQLLSNCLVACGYHVAQHRCRLCLSKERWTEHLSPSCAGISFKQERNLFARYSVQFLFLTGFPHFSLPLWGGIFSCPQCLVLWYIKDAFPPGFFALVTFPCIYSASCLAWGISRVSKGSTSELLSSSGLAGLAFSGGIPHWADEDTSLKLLTIPLFLALSVCLLHTHLRHLPLVSFGSFQLLILTHVSPSPLDFVTSFFRGPPLPSWGFSWKKKNKTGEAASEIASSLCESDIHHGRILTVLF